MSCILFIGNQNKIIKYDNGFNEMVYQLINFIKQMILMCFKHKRTAITVRNTKSIYQTISIITFEK